MREIRRRSFLATAVGVSVAGCTALGDSGDRDLEDDVQEEIVDEEQLLEISVTGSWTSLDELRYLGNDDQLQTLEPSRERWVQPMILIDHLGESTLEQLEKPAISDVELVSLETGDRFEAPEWPLNGVEFDAIREDLILPRRDRSDWYTSGKTSLRPIFDTPAGDVALDVSEILDQDSGLLLR